MDYARGHALTGRPYMLFAAFTVTEPGDDQLFLWYAPCRRRKSMAWPVFAAYPRKLCTYPRGCRAMADEMLSSSMA